MAVTMLRKTRGVEMKRDLKEITQQWMQLERKTLEQRKQADEFYESNLMSLIEEDFIERNKELES